MKTTRLLLTVLFFIPAVALAGFKLPSKVFNLEGLEAAKKEAAAKGKPLSILYSNKDSTCPLCNNASTVMIKELGSKTVMVYVSDINALPSAAKEALREGSYIPKIAVFDDKLEKSLGTVTYEAVKEDARSAFRAVDKAIREYKKGD